ncbi:MAG: hypothetical protein IT168_17580 [Bryobacterales bacterium]|nr:hypothetical protein [Bryobacterales bacterium]
MSEEKKETGIKDYAGGWITEREGTDVPGFLKLAFPIIGLFCVGYLVFLRNGETTHSDRGVLVQALNKVTGNGDTVMYLVTALALVYVAVTVLFAIRKNTH